MKSKTLFYLILLTLIISLALAARAQTFSVIHDFTGGTGGGGPDSGVTIRGNALYGTTTGAGCGSVYQLTYSGSNWLFSTLVALTNENCHPRARVVFGPDGHLYGTSLYGGINSEGTVFKLAPPVGICKTVACYWTVSDLYDFDYSAWAPGDGALIWDQQGNIYGTTTASGCCGGGVIYQLTPSGNGYTFTILYPAGSAHGVVLDNKGNLFGTVGGGGAYGYGFIFELSYVPGVGWTYQDIYSFQNAGDGQDPESELTFDSAGNLCGTTSGGCCDIGTVFELSPSGNSWVLTTLYTLAGHSNAGVALGPDGAVYGTSWLDGFNSGSVFKLTKTQNGWQYTSLHDFVGLYTQPVGTVTFDTQGNLYGAAGGGTHDEGVVWMITP